MATPPETKRWFSVTQVEPGKVHDAPPAGEHLAENIRHLHQDMLNNNSLASSNWTTWTTGMPPDTQTDGGYEIDF